MFLTLAASTCHPTVVPRVSAGLTSRVVYSDSVYIIGFCFTSQAWGGCLNKESDAEGDKRRRKGGNVHYA